jgi:hypothetical protein
MVAIFVVVNGLWMILRTRARSLKEARAAGIVSSIVPNDRPISVLRGGAEVDWVRVTWPFAQLDFHSEALVMYESLGVVGFGSTAR